MSRRVQCCSSFKHPKIVNWPPWHGQLSSPSKEWHSEQIGRKKGWAKAGSRFKKCRDIFKAKTHNNWQHRTMRPIKYSESIGKQKDFPKEPARAKKKEKGSIDIYRSKLFENMFSKVILYVYIYILVTHTLWWSAMHQNLRQSSSLSAWSLSLQQFSVLRKLMALGPLRTECTHLSSSKSKHETSLNVIKHV